MSVKPPSGGFYLFRGSGWFGRDAASGSPVKGDAEPELSPTLKLATDKEVYRSGDAVTVTVEISTAESAVDGSEDVGSSFLVDSLSFEIKGIEKVDAQWFSLQKLLPQGPNQRRGENALLDGSVPKIASKVIVAPGQTKGYVVRAELPNKLPPSYRGTSIRYVYYIRCTLSGRWLVLDNEHLGKGISKNVVHLEARSSLQIWVSQKSSNLQNEEGSSPLSADQLNISWRENDDDSEWTRANENADGSEEGYDSSKDDVLSVSSYNPARLNSSFSFKSSSSMPLLAGRLSASDCLSPYGEHPNMPSYNPLPRVSTSELSDDHRRGYMSPKSKLDCSGSNISPIDLGNALSSSLKDDAGPPFTPKHLESAASEGFIRGRSYNIRIEDQLLLRFSPKNSDSIYYFGDTIGGTLSFFHEEGQRRCLEVAISLETSETISHLFLHPSRKASPIITKVYSEHHEVVSDLQQTSFIFTVPMDGPMSFTTPKVSVQWSLRFEFFTTPAGLDLSRYEHPLLVETREKGDWVLPIVVYAPPPPKKSTQVNEKPSFGSFFHS